MKHKSLNELSNDGHKFAVIKIDETEHWREDIRKAAKQIFTVYLVDLTQPTHLCSLSVAFPAQTIKNFIPKPPKKWDDDYLTELEHEFYDETTYFEGGNRYSIEKLYDEGDLEEVTEYESGNPTVC